MMRTRLCELLAIEHPIVLVPMDIVSDARLVAAVSAAGGFGILGGGYGDAAWLTRELDLLAQSGQRFGVGFITWSLARQPALLDLVLARRPAAVMLSFGETRPFVKRIQGAGALAICQVQSLGHALEAASAGADVLVAQGTEGGGHGGSRGLFTLLPEIVDVVGDRLPAVAAGGIADGRGVAAALMLGASGVVIGTRFYASEESGRRTRRQRAHRAGARRRLGATASYSTSRHAGAWPAPFTGRCLRNELTGR